MSTEINAIHKFKEAVSIRIDEINVLYAKYKSFSQIACQAIIIKKQYFKKAVDAIYYLGGGYPNPSSPGRLEEAVSDLSEIYKILDFIGEAQEVERLFLKHGITISLNKKYQDEQLNIAEQKTVANELSKFNIKVELDAINSTKKLSLFIFNECIELQRSICQLADNQKALLKSAQKDLNISDPEKNRLFDLTKIHRALKKDNIDKLKKKKSLISTSFSGFNKGLEILERLNR